MNAEQLTNIIRNISWLNLSELERVCSIPLGTLDQVKRGIRKLPHKHIDTIEQQFKRLNFT